MRVRKAAVSIALGIGLLAVSGTACGGKKNPPPCPANYIVEVDKYGWDCERDTDPRNGVPDEEDALRLRKPTNLTTVTFGSRTPSTRQSDTRHGTTSSQQGSRVSNPRPAPNPPRVRKPN